ASLREPGLIPQTILTAADVRLQMGVTDWQNLVDFLREKTCLLVLDNCEHLIDDCARLAQGLLQEAPRLKILASSREALGVRGEQAWRVPSLSAPDARHLPPLEQLSRYEAVCLFTERACLVQPHFRVTAENATAVAEVCQRLDGIPLAIELAAARLRSLGVEKIAARLDDHFRLLTGGARTALPRQQTLRALIDWSYDLLPEQERTLLRRLAVFSGGWSLEGSEQICSDAPLPSEEILDMLDHLVDKSMVALKESQEARYSLLETIRQYARDKLAECGESAAARDRHLAYFVEWVTALEPGLRGPQQVELLEQVENELDNLRAAMEWSRRSDPAAGLLLASRLKWFWHLHDLFGEGAGWLKDLLASVKSGSVEMDPVLKAEALSAYSWMIFWMNDLPASRDSLQQSVVLVENEPGLLAARIRADDLFISGHLAIAGGDPSRAGLLGRQCLEAYKACGSPFGMAEACIVLYASASDAGDLEAARYWSETGIALRRKIGDKDGLAYDLTMGALVPFFQADYKGAKRMLAEAMQACRETRFRYSMGLALGLLGMTCLFADEPGQALDYFSQHAALAGETSDATLKTFNLYFLTWLFLKLGQYRPALQLIGTLEVSNLHRTATLYAGPALQEGFEQYRQEARQALGEAEYNAAYAEGRLLSLDSAIAQGLQQAEAALQP
ncbi:MAG: ATP-binding protein, partial [Bacteroidota bacterium]